MGDGANIWGGTASLVNGMNSVGSGIAQSKAQRAQGEYQQRMLELNARLSGLQGKEAIEQGNRDASEIKREAIKVEGAQRAASAASGQSGGQAVNETQLLSELDIIAAKGNAWRSAWGFDVQASDLRSQGEIAKIAGDASASNTLLTGLTNGLAYGLDAGSKFFPVPQKFELATKEEKKAIEDTANKVGKNRKKYFEDNGFTLKNTAAKASFPYAPEGKWKTGFINQNTEFELRKRPYGGKY